MCGCHEDAGHQGQDKTFSLVKQRFYWSSMKWKVRDYVKCCGRCVKAKTPEAGGHAPLQIFKTAAPMELVCIDSFWYYGFPEKIHSDQGANFQSELIAALLQISVIKKSHTTAYHPMGNGSVERFNQTLKCMIKSLPPRAKKLPVYL